MLENVSGVVRKAEKQTNCRSRLCFENHNQNVNLSELEQTQGASLVLQRSTDYLVYMGGFLQTVKKNGTVIYPSKMSTLNTPEFGGEKITATDLCQKNLSIQILQPDVSPSSLLLLLDRFVRPSCIEGSQRLARHSSPRLTGL